MAAKLGPETAKPARVWLLKQLQLIGRVECVDAVAALLDDADAEIRDAARAALANNPTPEANAKLVAQLSATGDASKRVALIHALGYRADPASVEVLGKQLADADASVAAAAAGALGKIGGPEAARLLAAAKQGSSELRRAIADARLCCANQMLNNGHTAEAAKIYQELGAPSQPRPIRRGALAGQLRAAGDGATAMVLEVARQQRRRRPRCGCRARWSVEQPGCNGSTRGRAVQASCAQSSHALERIGCQGRQVGHVGGRVGRQEREPRGPDRRPGGSRQVGRHVGCAPDDRVDLVGHAGRGTGAGRLAASRRRRRKRGDCGRDGAGRGPCPHPVDRGARSPRGRGCRARPAETGRTARRGPPRARQSGLWGDWPSQRTCPR